MSSSRAVDLNATLTSFRRISPSKTGCAVPASAKVCTAVSWSSPRYVKNARLSNRYGTLPKGSSGNEMGNLATALNMSKPSLGLD